MRAIILVAALAAPLSAQYPIPGIVPVPGFDIGFASSSTVIPVVWQGRPGVLVTGSRDPFIARLDFPPGVAPLYRLTPTVEAVGFLEPDPCAIGGCLCMSLGCAAPAGPWPGATVTSAGWNIIARNIGLPAACGGGTTFVWHYCSTPSSCSRAYSCGRFRPSSTVTLVTFTL